jgi:diguanylate cyclase (GGDEF)-like protein
MLDIDDFKHMNDTCGHSDGDTIILAIADALKAHFRDSDIISRYGGDEFLILMSGSSADHASERAYKLQQKIAQESFEQNCEDARKVTVSIGIASFPLNGQTGDSLIKAADAALYRAKALGKNCIEVA